MSIIDNLPFYKSILFDCDGVILNSNLIKRDAFFESAIDFGLQAAHDLVDYHVLNGGISRYNKFSYFLDEIIKIDPSERELLLASLLRKYASLVLNGLLHCEIASGLIELRTILPTAKWFIVSGGDQDELREVFARRKISHIFDGGIYGSPSSKFQIIEHQLKIQNIVTPALFLGDSKYDFISASEFSLDFLFLSKWTEVKDYEDWMSSNSISSVPDIETLMHLCESIDG